MDVAGAEAGPLDVVSVGELVVDFISVEQTDTLGNATTFRRYLGGSPANIAVYVSRLGGTAAIISKTGIGAFGKFLKSQLGRHGVITDYLIMDHRTNTTIVFVSSTSGTPDFEEFRSGDYLLTPGEVSDELVERVGPLPKVRVENVTGARDAFWSALLVAHLDGKGWEECVRFAHEVATLKLQVEGHVERMIDREALYKRLETPAERRA